MPGNILENIKREIQDYCFKFAKFQRIRIFSYWFFDISGCYKQIIIRMFVFYGLYNGYRFSGLWCSGLFIKTEII